MFIDIFTGSSIITLLTDPLTLLILVVLDGICCAHAGHSFVLYNVDLTDADTKYLKLFFSYSTFYNSGVSCNIKWFEGSNCSGTVITVGSCPTLLRELYNSM